MKLPAEVLLQRVFRGGVFLLPLAFWPGLEHPFSTPKIWLLACLDVALAAQYLARKEKPACPWPLLAWLAALGLSASLAPTVSLHVLLLAMLAVPLFWAARANELRQTILLASAAQSAITVLQYSGLDPLRWFGWQPELFESPRMRVYGTLGNPDFVAAWLCATLPLYADALGKGRSTFETAAWRTAAALQVAAILATGSRVFLLALPVGLAVLALCRVRLGKWWLVGLPLAAALILLSPARPLGVTVEGRMYFVRVIAGHLPQVPVTGYGPGSFPLLFAPWQVEWLRQHGNDPSSRFAGPLDHAHNDYLEMWVEYGPAGLCAFLALCAWIAAKSWPRRAKYASIWAAAAVLAAIACVDFPFHRPAEWGLFWLLLGMLTVNSTEWRRQDD